MLEITKNDYRSVAIVTVFTVVIMSPFTTMTINTSKHDDKNTGDNRHSKTNSSDQKNNKWQYYTKKQKMITTRMIT